MPRWENVHLSVDMPANTTAFLLFEAIIPSGSQGFYVAVDNIQVRAVKSKEEKGLYILTGQLPISHTVTINHEVGNIGTIGGLVESP